MKCLFSRYLDLYVFGESTNFKACGVIIDVMGHYTLLFQLFFRIMRSINIKLNEN